MDLWDTTFALMNFIPSLHERKLCPTDPRQKSLSCLVFRLLSSVYCLPFIVPCFFFSCVVLCCLVLCFLILSCLASSRRVVSLSCDCLVFWLSYLVLSCLVLCCLALHCGTLILNRSRKNPYTNPYFDTKPN